MPAKRYRVNLTRYEREQLLDIARRGKSSARKVKRSLILCKVDEGLTDQHDAYMMGWSNIQKEHMKTAEACFSPIPILHVPLFPREIVGVDLLSEAAVEVFGGDDPTAIYHTEKPFEIDKKNGEYRLTILLPFAEKENIELWVRGDDLILRVNNVKRSIGLPRALTGREVKRAKLEDGRFEITFKERRR